MKLLLRVVEVFRQHGNMVTWGGARGGARGGASGGWSLREGVETGGAVCPLATGQALLGSERIFVRPRLQPLMAAPPPPPSGKGKGRVVLENGQADPRVAASLRLASSPG